MKQELEYPEKMYTLKNGRLFSSRQMAEMQKIGIKKLEEQLKQTTDQTKVRLLKNRLREINLFVLLHADIKQFMK